MTTAAIVWPVVAMVVITFLVWLTLYAQRLSEMSRQRIAPQQLASRKEVGQVLRDTRASDNFQNLFEQPMLFHLAALMMLVTATVDDGVLVLAWIFVALRATHSLIHCTYNRVLHRFIAYALSSLVLWVIWARLIHVWLS